jgi:hypothetical protein
MPLSNDSRMNSGLSGLMPAESADQALISSWQRLVGTLFDSLWEMVGLQKMERFDGRFINRKLPASGTTDFEIRPTSLVAPVPNQCPEGLSWETDIPQVHPKASPNNSTYCLLLQSRIVFHCRGVFGWLNLLQQFKLLQPINESLLQLFS